MGYRQGPKIEPKLFSLELFGHPWDIPAKFSGDPAKSFSLGFEGHTELFGPISSRGEPPPHRKISGANGLSLCFFVA